MRAIHFVLIAWAAFAGAAVAQNTRDAATSEANKTEVAPIQFDLSARKPVQPKKLPTATTLNQLTYATEDQPETKPAPKAKPKPAPKPAPRPVRKVVVAKATKGPWMSEWRRAYIAKHGHQPPVPAR